MSIDISRAKELFLAALERPVHERGTYLDSVCGGDTALRRRVDAMLKNQELSGELLPRPAAELLADDDSRGRHPRGCDGGVRGLVRAATDLARRHACNR